MAAKQLTMTKAEDPKRIKPRIRTMWTFQEEERNRWTTKQKSLTVPDQAMTVREIANRFASGMLTLNERIALYDDGKEIIKDFDKLDLVDKQKIVEHVRTQIQNKREEMQKIARQKHDENFKALVEAEITKRKAAEQQQQQPNTDNK